MTRSAQLWATVLIGPVVWFVSLLSNFALAPWACALGWKPALFALSAVTLAVAAASGLVAWRFWRQEGAEPPGESGGIAARERSLALAGVLLSAMSCLIIVAQSVPQLILGACE